MSRKKAIVVGPISCYKCEHMKCYMKEVGKHHYKSQYVCGINNNELPSKLTILIPKWCPEGYENLFNL